VSAVGLTLGLCLGVRLAAWLIAGVWPLIVVLAVLVGIMYLVIRRP
jgi:hypothetical protein